MNASDAGPPAGLAKSASPFASFAISDFIAPSAIARPTSFQVFCYQLMFNLPAGLLRIMNRDLIEAGIEKEGKDGSVIHLHALRHSFGTHLSRAGVAPRIAQAAMRHSNIALTMNAYTDLRLRRHYRL